jgi:hypothetical protein
MKKIKLTNNTEEFDNRFDDTSHGLLLCLRL